MGTTARATLRDVARQAGVSPAAASVALNGSGARTAHIRVGAAARERVLKAARALRYQPNAAARALRGQSQLVGVVLQQPPDRPDFHQRYVVSLQRELYARGYQMLLGTVGTRPDAIRTWLDECRRHCAAGVLVVVAGSVEEQLRREGLDEVPAPDDLPLVGLGAEMAGNGNNVSFCLDATGAARAATAHLIALGHRRILLAGVNHPRRLAGCHEAVTAAGLVPEEVLFSPNRGGLSEGAAARAATAGARDTHDDASSSDAASVGADAMFARGRRTVHQVYGHLDAAGRRAAPTAIVANNDQQAAGALAGLRELGIRVPDDVAVVGCDNDPFGAYLEVPLTTVDFGVPEITRRAVVALTEKIERLRAGGVAGSSLEALPEPPPPRMVAARLVVRRSCGATRHDRPPTLAGGGKEGVEER